MEFSRPWRLGFCALLLWLAAAYGQSRPEALGPDAPVGQFSAVRAQESLARLLGPQRPHPTGSAENDAVRARLLVELARLGVPTRTLTAMSCNAGRGTIACGTVHDVIAEAMPGRGKTILLMAHFDSVPAGPGASDDMAGVAAILETLRALKTGAPGGHPVLALLSDGEEAGLLGASAFLHDRDVARVGMVINAEARGTAGPSYLFQTSAGDGGLVDLYARSVSHYAASSLYAEIYKRLPNDTDLTPFLTAGYAGYNFAFIGNAAAYHTPGDRRAALDPRSLQQQGDNLLGLARALRGADFATLKRGDAIYFDVLGLWLPRLPQRGALPLAMAAFILIAFGGGMSRRRAALMPPVLVGGALALGFVLHGAAAWISGHGDPSFAHPLALRLALGGGVFGLALLAMPFADVAACWLWLSGLGVVVAIFAPGAVPYFLFPALVAAPLLLVTARAQSGARNFALLVAGLVGALVWIALAAGTEAVMGLAAHPLFTVCMAFGFLALLPAWSGTSAPRMAMACLALALLLAIGAGLLPAYDAQAPERLNLGYAQEDGKAVWLADGPLPSSLGAAAAFSPAPQSFWQRGYAAAAGSSQFTPPTARIARTDGAVTLDLQGSREADGMWLAIPAAAHVGEVEVDGHAVPAPQGGFLLICSTPDCARAHVVLHGAAPFTLHLAEMRYGLPPKGAMLRKARPDGAVPSQLGDRSLIAATLSIP